MRLEIPIWVASRGLLRSLGQRSEPLAPASSPPACEVGMGARQDSRYLALVSLLRRSRRGKRLTQAAVARRVGRPQSFVSKVEAGARRLDPIELVDLCAALGVSACELVLRIEARPERGTHGGTP